MILRVIIEIQNCIPSNISTCGKLNGVFNNSLQKKASYSHF